MYILNLANTSKLNNISYLIVYPFNRCYNNMYRINTMVPYYVNSQNLMALFIIVTLMSCCVYSKLSKTTVRTNAPTAILDNSNMKSRNV